MSDPENILIIDDEEAIRDSCKQVLTREGYRVFSASDAQEGLQIFQERPIHTILLDLKLPGKNGMELLPTLRKLKPDVPVIIITGFATIESAVEAIKLGAFDYISKPFTPAELRVVVNKALRSRELYTQAILFQKGKEDTGFDMVIGKSKAMEQVVDIVRRVSASESTVLITGESGTGKELLAREIHKHSLRKNAPFVVVDCGALVETLFESELFGHVKGSFTGAHVTKHGRFEVADGGTIFLDEISNISLNIQAKLLRAIQEKEITRIGSTRPTKVDVRIIAATNENLTECVKAGKFREDLFYRLSVVPVHLPPLRERKEDIPLLIDHFLKKYNKGKVKGIKKISQQVRKALIEYNWPGNIRELENTIERAVVLSRKDEIEIQDLIYHGIGSSLSFMQAPDGKFKTLEDIEKEYINIVLQAQHGNKRPPKYLESTEKLFYPK